MNILGRSIDKQFYLFSSLLHTKQSIAPLQNGSASNVLTQYLVTSIRCLRVCYFALDILCRKQCEFCALLQKKRSFDAEITTLLATNRRDQNNTLYSGTIHHLQLITTSTLLFFSSRLNDFCFVLAQTHSQTPSHDHFLCSPFTKRARLCRVVALCAPSLY